MQPAKDIRTAALYSRTSTRNGSQDNENQLAQMRQYCQRQGWVIVHEYVDQVSGGSSRRPEFLAMMSDAHQCHFDIVLFWALDRFSRQGVLQTLKHLEQLDSYGVAWRSLSEEYLDSLGAFKDAVLAILATVAKMERSRISERVHAGLERARRHGRIGGRPKRVVDVFDIQELRARGVTWPAIAAKLGVSLNTLARRMHAHADQESARSHTTVVDNSTGTSPCHDAIQP